MVSAPRIETDRLVLRLHRDEDTDGFAEMMGDPEVVSFLGTTPLIRQEAWRRMATAAGQWVLRGYGPMAVEEKATGRFIGQVGPLKPEGWPGLEVGWVLARRAWGKGYAAEAARAAAGWAFQTQAVDRVISLIAPGNTRSQAVARRIGETHDGEVFQHWSAGPLEVWAIARSAFEAARVG